MERRLGTRRVSGSDEGVSRLRLRTGRELRVLNVSSSGVLAESGIRLLPGTHVDVHLLTSTGRVLVRSRVARCYVAILEPDAVRYRAALAFDRHIAISSIGYDIHIESQHDRPPAGLRYPHHT